MRPIPPAAAYESRTNRPRTCRDVDAYAPDAAYAISALRRDRAYRCDGSARVRVQTRSSRRVRAYRCVRGVENSQETVTGMTSCSALLMGAYAAGSAHAQDAHDAAYAAYAVARGPQVVSGWLALGDVPDEQLGHARPVPVPPHDTARSGSPNSGTSRRTHGSPSRWQAPGGDAPCPRGAARRWQRDTGRIGIQPSSGSRSRAPLSPLAGARTPGPRTFGGGSNGNGRGQRPRPAPGRGCTAGAAPVLDRRRRRASDSEPAGGSPRGARRSSARDPRGGTRGP